MDKVTEGQGADLIGIAEIATLLAVGRTTAFRLAKEPGFPRAFKLGSKIVKYSRVAVLAWLQGKQEQ